jgi:hypothetical protein
MNFIQSLLSRRHMMAGIATSAAVVASASGNAKQVPAKPARKLLARRPLVRPGSLATASVDDWKQQVGTTFETSTGHRLRLTEVRELAARDKRPAGLRERPFTASFDVVAGSRSMPEQLTLRVNHKVGGTFDMFVTAAHPDSPLRRVAVFA